MPCKERYTVKVRPARWGFRSSVAKHTLLYTRDDGSDFWMGWSPEPSFWRPSRGWAIRRARRKQAKLEAKRDRLGLIESVGGSWRDD